MIKRYKNTSGMYLQLGRLLVGPGEEIELNTEMINEKNLDLYNDFECAKGRMILIEVGQIEISDKPIELKKVTGKTTKEDNKAKPEIESKTEKVVFDAVVAAKLTIDEVDDFLSRPWKVIVKDIESITDLLVAQAYYQRALEKNKPVAVLEALRQKIEQLS
jgi:hypothetical protein